MNYEAVKKIITESGLTSVRIQDTSGNRVIDFVDETSPENLILRLDDYLTILKTYGRLHFIAATKTQKEANWKGAYKWTVVFSDAVSEQPKQLQTTIAGPGYISEREAKLMRDLEVLKLTSDFNMKLKEFEARLNDSTQKKGNDFEKYLPMLAFVPGFKLDQQTVMNAMQLAQMQGMMNGKLPQQQTGIAGVEQQQSNKTSVQLTDEEIKQVQQLNENIESLTEKTSLENLIKLTEGLNANPQFIEMALNFINQK